VRPERLPDLAAELVRRKVDIIVAATNPAIQAAREATRTIPIIMATSADPVEDGLVASLSRPGGNITGLTLEVTPETYGKRLQLLKEVVPKASRVAVLWNPTLPLNAARWTVTEGAARKHGVTLLSVEVRGPDDFEGAFATMTRKRVGGLIIFGDPLIFGRRDQTVGLAARNRLTAIYPWREPVEAGGLMAYGTNLSDLFRRAATYVDKILKGAKPADLPVEQPTRFELVINLKTAKALGLTIPQSVLIRADQVIR
jgi:putative ABC transport system substrate-binding protein